MARTYTFLGDSFVGDYVVSCLDGAGYEFVEDIATAQYIFTYHLFPSETDEVYFGEQGIFPRIQPGSYLVNLSSVSISLVEMCARMAQIENFYFVDAPLMTADLMHQRSYTSHEALMIALGAQEECLEGILPLLELMAEKVVYAGLPGRAQALKGATTIMLASQAQAMSETLAYMAASHETSKHYAIDSEYSKISLEESLDTLALLAHDLGLMSFASVQLFESLRSIQLDKGLYLRILVGDCFGALASIEEAQTSLAQFEAIVALLRLLVIAAPAEASCAALSFLHQDLEAGKAHGFNWDAARDFFEREEEHDKDYEDEE